jgi:hypothetical protein
MEKDHFFDFLDEIHQFQSVSPESKPEKEPPEPKEQIIPNERIAFLLFPFFIDLIDQFKGKLKDIRNFTRTHHEKCGDKAFITYLSQMIVEEIKKTDLLQNSLLNYIRINNPILKTDTINTLIEEELKKCQVELDGRKIKLFKTLEKNLPETAVPDDQLRYILSCLLQYVLTSMPSSGGIGLYTRSLVHQRETGENETLGKKEGRQIEIFVVYTDHKKSTGQFEPTSEISARQKGGILDLTLRLVDEIVKRNLGIMKLVEDEKKQKTTISLRFPVERRKVVYYQAVSELSSRVRQSKTTFEKLSSLEEKARRG